MLTHTDTLSTDYIFGHFIITTQADFVHVDAEVSLLHAASLFQNRHVKFLPIMVPGSATVLALISHVEILEVCD